MPQVSKYGIPTPAAGNYTVLSTTPNAATNVPRNQEIRIEFTTAMLGSSISNSTITMSPSPSRTTTVFRDDCTVIIVPDTNLAATTSYKGHALIAMEPIIRKSQQFGLRRLRVIKERESYLNLLP